MSSDNTARDTYAYDKAEESPVAPPTANPEPVAEEKSEEDTPASMGIEAAVKSIHEKMTNGLMIAVLFCQLGQHELGMGTVRDVFKFAESCYELGDKIVGPDGASNHVGGILFCVLVNNMVNRLKVATQELFAGTRYADDAALKPSGFAFGGKFYNTLSLVEKDGVITGDLSEENVKHSEGEGEREENDESEEPTEADQSQHTEDIAL